MIVVMTIYVVPKFMGFFTELDADLPLITQIVLGISHFLRRQLGVDPALVLVGAVFALALAGGARETGAADARPAASCACRSSGRCSTASRCRNSAARSRRCSRAAFRSCPSFEIAVASVGNAFVRSQLEPTIQMVREGQAVLRRAGGRASIFTDMSIDMVKVGEATGSLDEMLNSVSDFLDEQVETRMARLLSLVEPLMLVFMGLIIAILLISIYLPMFSMLGSSKF